MELKLNKNQQAYWRWMVKGKVLAHGESYAGKRSDSCAACRRRVRAILKRFPAFNVKDNLPGNKIGE